MDRFRRTVLWTGIVSEIVMILGAGSFRDGGWTWGRPSHVPEALLTASLFPIGVVALGFSGRLDKFSTGTNLFAVILEVALFVGWVHSPNLQTETLQYFFIATGLPAVIVAVTVLFDVLQREA